MRTVPRAPVPPLPPDRDGRLLPRGRAGRSTDALARPGRRGRPGLEPLRLPHGRRDAHRRRVGLGDDHRGTRCRGPARRAFPGAGPDRRPRTHPLTERAGAVLPLLAGGRPTQPAATFLHTGLLLHGLTVLWSGRPAPDGGPGRRGRSPSGWPPRRPTCSTAARTGWPPPLTGSTAGPDRSADRPTPPPVRHRPLRAARARPTGRPWCFAPVRATGGQQRERRLAAQPRPPDRCQQRRRLPGAGDHRQQVGPGGPGAGWPRAGRASSRRPSAPFRLGALGHADGALPRRRRPRHALHTAATVAELIATTLP